MATKLKGLKITSTDLVDQGANPDAHVRLFKRGEQTDSTPEPSEGFIQKLAAAIAGVFGKGNLNSGDDDVTKRDGDAKTFGENLDREKMRRITGEIWDFCYALSDSLSSILFDESVGEADKQSLMNTSLEQFTQTVQNAIPNWAATTSALAADPVAKSAAQEAAFDLFWDGVSKGLPEATESDNTDNEPGANNLPAEGVNKSIQKEETDTMKIDKAKMTAEEQATLADFEKRYGVADEPTPPADVAKGTEPAAPADGTTETGDMHPEVKKALADLNAQTAEIEELKKSLETERLTAVCKKYEIIGKKPEELAAKLYDLKKSGGTAYDDYTALLDEQVTLYEKSGMFSALGSDRSGTGDAVEKAMQTAAEVRKSNTDLSDAAAIVKSFEDNPELMAQYEAEYKGGK
jgi:hypothetical protein